MEIEIFKTNVGTNKAAQQLLKEIHNRFSSYSANFDLEDCDKILRVESSAEINGLQLINLLQNRGFQAEILAGDENFELQLKQLKN